MVGAGCLYMENYPETGSYNIIKIFSLTFLCMTFLEEVSVKKAASFEDAAQWRVDSGTISLLVLLLVQELQF